MPVAEATVLSRNGFFTYLVGTKKNGDETVTTRKLDQIFNYDGITFQIQGSYTRKGKKTGNYFGKKHVLATRAGGKDADAKAGGILDKRLNPSSKEAVAARAKKTKLLKSANAEKAPAGTATQPKDSYGDRLTSDKPSSTFFVIDGLSSDQVKTAFTTAIKGNCTMDDDTHLELDCGAGHVWQMDESKNIDKTTYTKLQITVFFDGTIYNIHHCSGPA